MNTFNGAESNEGLPDDPRQTSDKARHAPDGGAAPDRTDATKCPHAPNRPDISALPTMPPDLPDLMPARMLNEFTYCPRLYYLEFVQAQFVDSADTIEGRLRHKRVDVESGDVPSPGAKTEKTTNDELSGGDEVDSETEDSEAEPIVARSLMLSAPTAGLIARIDLLEADGRTVRPVDYKRGAAPDIAEGAWEPDRVQLCAQAIILRENGYTCEEGVVYYASSKTRITVRIDDDLVQHTFKLLQRARQTAVEGRIPPPLIDSPKCPRCSLVGICLPDEIHTMATSDGARRETEVRRLLPARDDPQPVYIQAQGGRLGKTGDRISVVAKDKPKQTIRILDISQINLFGNIQVSTQALRELAQRGIPICYFSFGGWFQAVTTGLTHKNVELRIRQFDIARRDEHALCLARAFIHGKVRNCRTMLRRNHIQRPAEALRDLNDLRKRVEHASSAETLLGLEGNAARIYFGHFSGMMKLGEADPMSFDFQSRNRRPPRDPVNAMLSYAYSLLVKDLTITLMSVGFDPYLGFYHRPRYGRPALALDLAEEFRPLIADSVVIGMINNGEIRRTDFLTRAGGCSLKEPARRQLIAAYERRLDSLVTHPLFGYTISYRRVLEVQARLLGAHLMNEVSCYTPFCTR